MAMLENFALIEEKILCLNYPISKLDGVYLSHFYFWRDLFFMGGFQLDVRGVGIRHRNDAHLHNRNFDNFY